MVLGTHLDNNFIQLTDSSGVTVEVDYLKILCMRPYMWGGCNSSKKDRTEEEFREYRRAKSDYSKNSL
jgi:hypothetical protein